MMKIIYVEDEIAHVELTQRTLEDNLQGRFVLLHAESLRGALELVANEPDIDLVLTDLRLPDGSGLELLKKVKELQPAPAVVLVTGQGDEQVAVAALKAGAADYLVKEGDYLHRLPAALTNAIAQNQLGREQAALRAAEHRFRVLVEQLPAAVYTDNHDLYSSAMYVSPQIKDIIGFSAEEWLANPLFWLARVHPDDLERVHKELELTYESLADFNLDYRYIHKDGRVVWVRDFARIIRDEAGEPKYWQGILFDITREVEAQAILRASEERFRRIFHSTPIATCVVTMEEGRFIDANLAFVNLVGIALPDLVGHTSQEVGFWESAADRETFLNKLKTQGALQGIEIQYKNVPNGPRETLAFYELIELGGTTCILSMFYDVTDQKKAQQALQAERDFALQVLNNMGQGLTIIGRDSRFEYINPAYANMIGYLAGEILGKRPADFTIPENEKTLTEERSRRQKGIKSTYEIKLRHKDGHEVPVMVTGVPRQQAGSVNGAISVVTDLTIQKQTEQALERQVRELTVLHAVATAEAEGRTEDEIITKVTSAIHQIYSDVCGILLLDETGTILTPHSSYLGADISNWRTGYPISEGVTGKSVTTGSIIRLGDATREPGYIEIASRTRSELCVPIRVHERVIGVINVESHEHDAFTEHDEGFLTTVASGLGTALERLRLFTEEQRRARELDALYRATKPLTQSLQPGVIAENLLSILDDLLGYDYASIHLIDEQKQYISPLVIHPKQHNLEITKEEIDFLRTEKRALGDGIIGWVAQHGQPIRTGDASREKRYLPVIKNITSELCVPLIARDHVIGAINIETVKPNAYSERDENLLSALANSAAIALENARLYEVELERRKEAELLREATAALGTSLELKPLLAAVLDSLEQLIPYDSASVFLKRSEDEMEIVAVKGFSAPEKVVGRHVLKSAKWHQLAVQKKVLIMDDAQADSLFEKWDGSEHIRGWMGVPMIAREEVIGFINLDSRTRSAFTERQATIAQTFANSVAVAIQNAHLFESEKHRRQEAETLRHAASIISSTLDTDTVAREILTVLKQIIPYHSGSVFLHEGDKLRIAMAYGYPHSEQLKNLSFPDDDEFFQVIKNTGQPVIVEDVSHDERFKNWGNFQHIRGWMVVPLVSRGRVIGAITLDSTEPASFDHNTGMTALAFAHQAAAAIDNARLYNETQRRLIELEIINRVSTSLRLAQSLDEILPILLNEALLLVDTPHGSIWLYDHSNNILVQRTARGAEAVIKHKSLKPGEGIIGHVFSSGEKYITPELKSDLLLFAGNRDSVTPGLGGICIPIKSTVGPMGVLMVSIETGRQITEEINLLTILAEITGNAIHRTELFEQSQEQIHRLTTLRDIDSAIASSTDLRVTLNILMDHTIKHLKADAVDILLYHPDLQSLTYLCSVGFFAPSPTRPLMRLGEGLAGQVVMKGSIEHIQNLQASSELVRDPLLVREGFVSYFGVPLIVKGQIKGVFEIYMRVPFSPTADWMQFLQTLSGQAAIAIDNAQLFDNLQRSNQEITQAYDTTLEGWARALELRDRETEGHTRRVTEMTINLATFMGLSGDELINVYRGVLLHDIGKMGVPDQILRKTGALNESEWAEMRKHPEYAFNLLAPIPYLRPALDIPYCHHEHWDGSGYPRGLKGEQIPIAARIFSIVDIWDALLSDRPYRKAWSREKVIRYLKEISGTILDPRVVVEFFKMIGEEQ